MLYNPVQAFEAKIDTLSIDHFYTEPFMRGEKKHYTEVLNIEEGVKYDFGNDYSRLLLKRLVQSFEVQVMVYGCTVIYNEYTNTHEYEPLTQWITIDCYSLDDGEYRDEHFVGTNEEAERCTIFIDDIDNFLIIPTQKPKGAVRYEQ